jgi:signal transduction histidine kinase
MKLVPKLSAAFIAGVSIILAANGYFRVEREVAQFESDRIRDDVAIGQTLGAAVSSVWRADGEAHALALVKEAGERQARVRVRWLWLEGDDRAELPMDRELLLASSPSSPLTRTTRSASGELRRSTFVPVVVPGAARGAIEISESLEPERAYVRRTMIDTVVTALSMAGVCALLAMVLGVLLVGRPIGALIAKARRTGRGDFGGPLELRRGDELGELAFEMNAMCDQLVEANARVQAETKARFTMIEQLRHADRLMTVGKLASGIAHELGTPLNVVEARASMIAGGETTQAESADYARIIVRASEQMTRIIRQVLAFARPRAAEKVRCDLAQIPRHTIELLKPLADKKRAELVVAEASAPVVAEADAGQIEQAMTNLVMNAIQAMDRPGKITVAIDTARAAPPPDVGGAEGDFVRLRVRDEGRGIAPEHLAHVFEPFFTTKDVGEGTGLGLSVTYGIVREHGGWIAVDSEIGRGTELTVYLPASEGP